jgi:DNA-binding response OmpR family regulator
MPPLTVTVHIDPAGEPLPAAAEGLLESLRSLVGVEGVVVRPRPVPRPAAENPSLRIHLASRTVLRDGVPIRLTRREYDLLRFLCENPSRVFSRGQLLRQVWGYDMLGGERTVDVHVRRLRLKVGGRGPLIATVRGVGYRLDDAARVAVLADPE